MKTSHEVSFTARTAILLFTLVASVYPASALHPLSQAQQKHEDDDAVRLGATLVQVPAIVTNQTGKFVGDLAKSDFTLYEDGKRQEISVFAAVKQAFHAVLVLDTSNSSQDRLRAIQNTALGFTRQLGTDDRMMVISFDNEVRQLTDFTADAKELESTIRGTESGFGKLLYEAVSRALEQLRDQEGRRAVILFSDGVDMRSIEATLESTTRLAEEIGAVIYVVHFDTRWWTEAEARKNEAEHPKSNTPFNIDGRIPLPPEFGGPEVPTNPEIPTPQSPRITVGSGSVEVGSPRHQPRVTYDPNDPRSRPMQLPTPDAGDPISKNLDKLYGEADTLMQTLTQRTGGRIFEASTFENTRTAFATIADELRNLYLLGYYPSGTRRDGKFHKLKLEVARKAVQVRARQGYRK
jgi:Ca-activated chloride channel homolog